MKVGDQVKIKDGSYMLCREGTTLVHFQSGEEPIGRCKDTFTVLAMDCRLPAFDSPFPYYNDTVIVNNTTFVTWFCKGNVNLKLVPACEELTVDEISRRLGYEVKIVK